MDRSRRNRKYSNNWNNQKNNSQEKNKQKQFVPTHIVCESESEIQEKNNAIQEIKSRQLICPKCGELITDIASAMVDSQSGKPMHFECALAKLKESEKIEENEKISYIGHGRFAILKFENPRDQRHFEIKKIIEWEKTDVKVEWREELSSLYSQVK
jgi:hypothetical protein